MQDSVQRGLRQLTKLTRPLALRSAGKQGSGNSVMHHVGRETGRPYETPVVAAEHDGSVYIALPYGERTDWLKNVLAAGSAAVVTGGNRYGVDQPKVIPMGEATGFFATKEQRLHRRFGVRLAFRSTWSLEPRLRQNVSDWAPAAYVAKTLDQWAALGYTRIPAQVDDPAFGGNNDPTVCGNDLGKFEPDGQRLYEFRDNDVPG